jgi:hypothetical protein
MAGRSGISRAGQTSDGVVIKMERQHTANVGPLVLVSVVGVMGKEGGAGRSRRESSTPYKSAGTYNRPSMLVSVAGTMGGTEARPPGR